MSREIFKERERALEYEFCHKVDQKLLEKLRDDVRSEERLQALERATGIGDHDVLRSLDEMGISGECIVALSLYPLVHVAWADQRVQRRERAAILNVVEVLGHGPDSASYHLLEHWMDEPPSPELFAAWRNYVAAILDTMPSTGEKLTLQEWLMGRARRVAAAAGGVLGVHAISKSEQAALEALQNAFDDTAL